MTILPEELKKIFHFHFTKYSQQTSLHGWQYLASEDSGLEGTLLKFWESKQLCL